MRSKSGPGYKTLPLEERDTGAGLASERSVMNTDEEFGDDELTDYVIQLSIQDSCHDAWIRSNAKYGSRVSSLSLETVTGEHLSEHAAIRQDWLFTGEMLHRSPALCDSWLTLHQAACQPVLEVLQRVLRVVPPGPCLEERTGEAGETPMTLAAQAGMWENVWCLLAHGASPQTTNSRNESPLLLAVRGGFYQMTSVLVAGGAWVDQLCRRNWTALHEASRLGHTDILMLLLRNGAHVNQRTVLGMTPLAVAAEGGRPHIAEILLSCGSRVNSQALSGESVLMEAAGSGNPSCVRLLLENGADPNLPSITGHLPIHKAALAGYYDVLKMLVPLTSKKAIKAAGQSPLHSAADGGHSSCLQLLLANGFDVNYRITSRISESYRDMRRSALYFAVSNGDLACAKVLLEAGARADLDPLSCLLVAVRSGSHEMVRLLLAGRADVNCYFTVVSDTAFPTALQYCLKDPAMMRLLLNNGYDAERCFRCHHDTNSSDSKRFATRNHENGYDSERCARCNHDNNGYDRKHCARCNHDNNGYNDQRCAHCNHDNNGYNIQQCARCNHGHMLHARDDGSSKMPFCEFMGLCCLVHLSGRVVRILLDYVSHVDVCSDLRGLLQKQPEWPEISVILRSPRSLKHLCRLEIRQLLTLKRLNDPEVMNSDLFPPRLKHFLLYQELDLYQQGRSQGFS